MKIGFANGCFDLFHEGHRHFLQACRSQCDYLVVAVNSDAYCRRVKGSDRPYEPLAKRMIHVRSIAEAVMPFEGREENLIMEIRPDVVFKGEDHRGQQEFYIARALGWKDRSPADAWWRAPIVYIGRLEGFSTTLEARAKGLDHAQT